MPWLFSCNGGMLVCDWRLKITCKNSDVCEWCWSCCDVPEFVDIDVIYLVIFTQVGSDIYVCYKKSMNRSTSLAYKAGILDQYPRVPRPGFPVPSDLALFCLPMGATLESWPAQSARPHPVSSTFVLTVTAGESGGGGVEAVEKSVEKVYGAAVTFYEKYPHDRLTPEQRSALKLDQHFGRHNLVHTNKCVCILSRWPFFDAFDRFLRYLYQLTMSGPHTIPIERSVPKFNVPKVVFELHLWKQDRCISHILFIQPLLYDFNDTDTYITSWRRCLSLVHVVPAS